MATSGRRKIVDIDVRELVLIADALASTVATSFGPLPNEKLLVSNTRKVIISSSGATILARLVGAHPIARLVLDCAQAHVRRAGDGASAFVLGVAAALRAADAELRERPALERARHRRHLCWALVELQQHALPDALLPRWRAGAVCTPASEPAALRRDALRVARTSLGSAFGAAVSDVLARTLVDALLLAPADCSEEPDAASSLAACRARATGALQVLAVGGAHAAASAAVGGWVLKGSPAAAEMPTALREVRLLLLGRDAQPPGAERRAKTGANERNDVTLALGAGAAGADGVAVYSAAATAARRAWVDAARQAGVRLVLSAAPLGPPLVAALAAGGISAIQGIEPTTLADLGRAAGVSVVRRWPAAPQLRSLLERCDGGGGVHGGALCSFEPLRMGGATYTCVRLPRAPLCAALLRGPSPGLASEYSAAVTRALQSLRCWLGADDAGGGAADDDDALLSVAGGGAAELQLEALVGLRMGDSAEAAVGGEEAAARDLAQRSALRVLAAALREVPEQLHRNAAAAAATVGAGGVGVDGGDARRVAVIHALRSAHAQAAARGECCTLGLVVARAAADGDGGGGGVAHAQQVRDAAAAGVVEPLGGKVRLLDSMLGCLLQLLRVDGVVPARRRLHARSSAAAGSSSASESEAESDAATSDDDDGVLV